MAAKSLLAVIALATLSACVAPGPGAYEQFAATGHAYTESINNLLTVAQETAINKSSAELIDQNSFADRSNARFNQQEIRRLERIRGIDLKRIAVFNDIRAHVRAVTRYFTQLNELASTDEAEKTASALAHTAGTIDALTKKLGSQSVFSLDDTQKQKISTVVDYVIGAKQRALLKKQIEADQAILQAALATHEELFAVIADDLTHELNILTDRQHQMLVEAPFTAKKPLADSPGKAIKWMEDRQYLMGTQSAVGELNAASRAARSVKKTLETLLADDSSFVSQLEQLKAELNAIESVIDALKK